MSSEPSSSPRLLLSETQFFPAWAALIPIAVVTISVYVAVTLPQPHQLIGWIMSGWTIVLSGLLLVALGKMTTELTTAELRVRFGWIGPFQVLIPLHRIQGFEAITYQPIRAYGGWGMRGTLEGGGALNARGNRGVALLLDTGKTLVIGSQRPEELVEALGQAFASRSLST